MKQITNSSLIMNFRIESKLFGTVDINVDLKDYELDMWEDIGDHLCVNIFVHPDDEDKSPEDARHMANVWTLKRHFSTEWGRFLFSYGEELEHVESQNVIVTQ